MATRDEIADALAGMTLFADLTTPQLMGVAGRFEEAFFPEGAKVLRQGLSGSAFYVILDGEAAVVVDGSQRATLGRGEFFGEVSILLGEPPAADVVATRPLRCIVLPGAAVEAFLVAHPRVHVPDAPGAGAPAPERQPVAELSRRCRRRTRGRSRRASTPSSSSAAGPGGLQVVVRPAGATGSATRSSPPIPVARRHVPALAVLPAAALVDEAVCAGGPPLARVPALGLEQPARRASRSCAACRPSSWTARPYFPSRPEMEANLDAFAERAGIAVRYGCRWESHPPRGRPGRPDLRRGHERRRVPLPAPDPRGRRRRAVEPGAPRGSSTRVHYADTRAAETYAGKRLFIIGKQNSGFELASGLLQWASRITLASPSPAKTSIETQLPRRRPCPIRPAVRGLCLGWRRRHPGGIDRRDRSRPAASGWTSSGATTGCR